MKSSPKSTPANHQAPQNHDQITQREDEAEKEIPSSANLLTELLEAQQLIVAKYQNFESCGIDLSKESQLSPEQIVALFEASEKTANSPLKAMGETLEIVECEEAPMPDEYAAAKEHGTKQSEDAEINSAGKFKNNDFPTIDQYDRRSDGDGGVALMEMNPPMPGDHGRHIAVPRKTIPDPSQLVEVCELPSFSAHSENSIERLGSPHNAVVETPASAPTETSAPRSVSPNSRQESAPSADRIAHEVSARLVVPSQTRTMHHEDGEEIATLSPIFDGIPVPEDQNDPSSNQIHSQPLATMPTCNAVPIPIPVPSAPALPITDDPPPNNDERKPDAGEATMPWWKMNSLSIFVATCFMMVLSALMVTIGVIVGKRDADPVEIPSYLRNPTSATTIPTPSIKESITPDTHNTAAAIPAFPSTTRTTTTTPASTTTTTPATTSTTTTTIATKPTTTTTTTRKTTTTTTTTSPAPFLASSPIYIPTSNTPTPNQRIPSASPSINCLPTEVSVVFVNFSRGMGWSIRQQAPDGNSYAYFDSSFPATSSPNELHVEILCLPEGNYQFQFVGSGSYMITSGDVTLASNDALGQNDIAYFDVTTP